MSSLDADLDHVLRHAATSFEALRGANIFVTGGTGFFGRWLLESFAHANRRLELGARMVVLSRNPAAFAAVAPHLGDEAGIALVQGDVRAFDAGVVAQQLGARAPERYEFVIHAATEASAKLNAENPLLMSDTIVQGTRAALEFSAAVSARRFLLTSSGAVYGAQPAEMTHVHEEYAGAPDCTSTGAAYGESKRLAELLCSCYERQFSLQPLIARCFAFVGPFLPLDTHFAIGNFIRDAIRGQPIQIGGDGTPRRSYLYAADLAVWLWTILVRGTPMRPYNVGSAEDLSIAELAATVRDALGASVTVNIAREPAPGAPIARYVPAVDRAERELGLRPLISLPESIRRTASHARASSAARA